MNNENVSSQSLRPPDTIRISALRFETRIGVPNDERQTPQTIEAHLEIVPSTGSLSGLDDGIERTVDYFLVTEAIRDLAKTGERRLLETLAEDIADLVLERFGVRLVQVEIRKFILPDTDYVSVCLTKSAESAAIAL